MNDSHHRTEKIRGETVEFERDDVLAWGDGVRHQTWNYTIRTGPGAGDFSIGHASIWDARHHARSRLARYATKREAVAA